MSLLDIALAIGVAFVAVIALARTRDGRFKTRVRRSIDCPKTGCAVECTLVANARDRRWVDVADCARWHGGELEGPCDRGCVDVQNLRLSRDA